ncbi:MAG: conjugal transfer protein TraG N-terminal domain-containing protein, partial [Gammaproteobacteria bacterium]|nr:conjugal transfer protein TraG N-terminal domain-containing protein [Gammaproteobacteria bacterium]
MYEFYAYWNAEEVASIFQSIALIVGGGDYTGLMKAVAIGGLLACSGAALVRLRGEEPLVYLMVLAFLYGGILVPKVSVTIQDIRNNKVYTVANVPLGLAFFASQSSHLGKWLTETFETHFTPIDDTKFSRTGMVFGARLIEELQLLQVMTPSLRQNLQQFMKNCVYPEVVEQPALIDNLKLSSDLWADFGANTYFSLNPGRFTPYQNETISCVGSNSAYQRLTQELTNEATKQGRYLSAKLGLAGADLNTFLLTQIPNIENTFLNLSRSAKEAIQQGMLLNLMLDAPYTSHPPNAQSLGIALGTSVAQTTSALSYASMAKIAEGALPKLRNTLELLVIAIFPMVFIIVIAAGSKAGIVLKSYILTLIWVQLWAPLYAVINFMGNSYDKAQLLATLRGATGNNLDNFTELASTSLSSQSITGLLTLAVPLIAYALVKGSEVALSGIGQTITAPAQAMAQRAGEAIGQGNLSLGNVTWGNVNWFNTNAHNTSANNLSYQNIGAHKQDLASSFSSPHLAVHQTPNGVFWQDTGKPHQPITGLQTHPHSVGASLTQESQRTHRSGQELGYTQKNAHGTHQNFEESGQASSQSSSQYTQARQFSTTTTKNQAQQSSTQEGNAQTQQQSSGRQTTLSQAYQNSESFSADSQFGLGFGSSKKSPPSSSSPAPATSNLADASASQTATSTPSSTPLVPADPPALPSSGRQTFMGLSIGAGVASTNTNARIDGTQLQSSASQTASSTNTKQTASVQSQSQEDGQQQSVSRNSSQGLSLEQSRSTRASQGQVSSQQNESTVGQRSENSHSQQQTKSINSGIPLTQALLQMANGNPSKALELAQQPNQLAAALAQVSSETTTPANINDAPSTAHPATPEASKLPQSGLSEKIQSSYEAYQKNAQTAKLPQAIQSLGPPMQARNMPTQTTPPPTGSPHSPPVSPQQARNMPTQTTPP